MEIDKEIGERIAKKRIEKGLSQEELASRVNSSQGLIAKIETGNRKIQVDLLLQIVEVLDTDCDYLLRGIPTKYLSVAQLTGLSECAIIELKKLNHFGDSSVNLNQLIYDREKTDAIEALLCCEEGKEALSEIGSFINCDYSQFYIDEVNAEGTGFTPYNHSIGFKSSRTLATSTYIFVGPENFEYAAIAKITEAIKDLKKAISKKAQDNKKKVNQRKKKED